MPRLRVPSPRLIQVLSPMVTYSKRTTATLVLILLIGFAPLPLRAAGPTTSQWPAFRHDARRSGRTNARVSLTDLRPAWVFRSTQTPRPAWAGPALWDAYRALRGLKSMRNYDPVFHVTVGDGAVYFGSSVDDQVRCLALRTGKCRWDLVAGGPVRTAPTFYRDEATGQARLLFGADDGFVRCVAAADGAPVWRFAPGSRRRLVLHDGRPISFWPVRTPVVVAHGKAYFAASLLPWKKSYLCALDVATGSVQGAGTYVTEHDGITLEGPLVADADHLIVPQGRVAPLLFDRRTGAQQGTVGGGGGCFILVTDDDEVLHGPGNNTGWIMASSAESRADIWRLDGANAMVVVGDRVFATADDGIRAYDRDSRTVLWESPAPFPFSLILAGNTLFAGGDDAVGAVDVATGKLLWSHPVPGRAYGLAAVDSALVVSTDEGVVLCFQPGGGAAPAADTLAAARAGERQAQATGTPEAVGSPVAQVSDAQLLGRWVFQRDQITPMGNSGRTCLRGGLVRDLAGTGSAQLLGDAQIVPVGTIQAVRLDGVTTSISLDGDGAAARLPTTALTAEAWVRVDQPGERGAIISALGQGEQGQQGWMLGFDQSHFTLDVCTAPADTFAHVRAPAALVAGRWYHVAGTWDGRQLRLYVDGARVAVAAGAAGGIAYAPRWHYAIGAYRDQGRFRRLQGMIAEVRVYGRALSAVEVGNSYAASHLLLGDQQETQRITLGPYLEFTAVDAAVLRWRTATPTTAWVQWGTGGQLMRTPAVAPKTEHAVPLMPLRPGRVYTYRIHLATDAGPVRSREYRFDTFFNYQPTTLVDRADTHGGNRHGGLGATATFALEAAGASTGLCLLWGSGEIELARELATRSRMHVIIVEADSAAVADARQRLIRTGAYGHRLSVLQVDDPRRVPLPDGVARLLIAHSTTAAAAPVMAVDEVLRLLEPRRGVAVIAGPSGHAPLEPDGALTSWLGTRGQHAELVSGPKGPWALLRRPAVAGAVDWSHQYGAADNAGSTAETLGGVTASRGLEVQWLGRPGPRAHAERQPRKPAPLATDGRLFFQGWQRIIALDAYSGIIPWSVEIPGFLRFNVPRDCSNWCADSVAVYAVVRDRCWCLQAASGKLNHAYSVIPGPRSPWDYAWGYVGRQGALLLGSAVKQGASFTSNWGGQDWYDQPSGPLAAKVCSDNLFAYDTLSRKPAWIYTPTGIILNSTITADADHVYFVESRSPAVVADAARRVYADALWDSVFLVSLDLDTGARQWEQPLDILPAHAVIYLTCAEGRLVLAPSGAGRYQLLVFATDSGALQWRTTFPWPGGKADHGSHLSRPVIVHGRVFMRPRTFLLSSGEEVAPALPRAGCGSYVAYANAFVYRSGTVTLWNADDGTTSGWWRLRPDCWISTIPACGMLLAPEGGGGCSCGTWLETSVGFAPVAGLTWEEK